MYTLLAHFIEFFPSYFHMYFEWMWHLTSSPSCCDYIQYKNTNDEPDVSYWGRIWLIIRTIPLTTTISQLPYTARTQCYNWTSFPVWLPMCQMNTTRIHELFIKFSYNFIGYIAKTLAYNSLTIVFYFSNAERW